MSKSQDIEFKGSTGAILKAKLDLPDDESNIKAFGVYAHCFTCGKDLAVCKKICQNLADFGYGMLRFDFTGINQSEGDFADTTFSSNVKDVFAACNYLEEYFKAPQIIMGHSLGGAAALYAAAEYESAKVIITLNAPFQPSHVMHHFRNKIDEIKAKGSGEVELMGGKKVTIGKEFVEDIESKDTLVIMDRLYKPILVCHSPIDETVNISNGLDIFENAGHPKSFLSLPKSEHLLMRSSDSTYVTNIINEWIKAYI